MTDFSPDALWWLPALRMFLGVLFLSGAAWPWWSACWKGRSDWGAGLWPAGGIFVYILAAQLFWRTGWMEMNFVWPLLLMVCVGLAGYRLLLKNRPSPARRKHMRSEALRAFWVFTFFFVLWTLVRSADPGANHTEQPMDAMWVRAAMASDQPPIQDAWFGGAPATYYVDGHQALGFLGVLMGLHPAIAVNTGQIVWFALTGLLAFQAARSICPGPARTRIWAGILGSACLLFFSTPKGMVDAFTKKGHFWWWSASRVVQDGTTELITEFPFFSFYLGDNHAHVLGIPILILGLLAALQLANTSKWKTPVLLPMVLCIAWSWGIHPWQTPTVFAFSGMALLCRKQRPTLQEGKALLVALVPALILLWPGRAAGPELSVVLNTHGHTSLKELLTVFGFLLPALIYSMGRGQQRSFRLLLLLLIVGMWGVCEIIYLEDAFQSRMNTVFKVYLQIWIFLAVLSGVGWAWAFKRQTHFLWFTRGLLVVALLPGMTYALRLTGAALRASERSLHAWSAELPENQLLLKVAGNLIQPGERIIEAPGKSYQSHTSQLGTWTAGDTLLGWTGHQTQWRPGQPHPDPLRIYRAQTAEDLKGLLQELQPDWILWSSEEQAQVTLHPDWITWMDQRANRVVNTSGQILFRVKEH